MPLINLTVWDSIVVLSSFSFLYFFIYSFSSFFSFFYKIAYPKACFPLLSSSIYEQCCSFRMFDYTFLFSIYYFFSFPFGFFSFRFTFLILFSYTFYVYVYLLSDLINFIFSINQCWIRCWWWTSCATIFIWIVIYSFL